MVSSTLVAAPVGAFDFDVAFLAAAGAAQVVGLAEAFDVPAAAFVVGDGMVFGVLFDGGALFRVGDVAGAAAATLRFLLALDLIGGEARGFIEGNRLGLGGVDGDASLLQKRQCRHGDEFAHTAIGAGAADGIAPSFGERTSRTQGHIVQDGQGLNTKAAGVLDALLGLFVRPVPSRTGVEATSLTGHQFAR
ncbi:hypothetical protein OG788_39075 [Streptomyces sp. NBC_00647]|uniref:hypothetical protein n=1 Tax=Streptomyces sp. NBC_00647 TaxID=2975796 RepID=UPI003252E1A9